MGDWGTSDADIYELSLSEWQEWDQALGAPKEYLEDLLAAYVVRKRWEYKEQALAHFALQSELMGSKRNTEQPILQAKEGKNMGKPNLLDLAKIGFLIQ